MKQLYTQEHYEKVKGNEKLPLECKKCQNTFFKTKTQIKFYLKKKKNVFIYCSKTCKDKSQIVKKTKIQCRNCNKNIIRKKSEQVRNSNNFCSHSCSAKFNNKLRDFGKSRSKLEFWIEFQLKQLYPKLKINFNNRKILKGLELDIYIPSLNLAFELNGIFHYEPIYGIDKFQQIQQNDQSKSLACHQAKIDLCVIDTTQQKYFKEATSQKYLDIITNIINCRIS